MAGTGTGEIIKFQHPGAGRKRALSQPKGRQVMPEAKQEIATLLGDRARERVRVERSRGRDLVECSRAWVRVEGSRAPDSVGRHPAHQLPGIDTSGHRSA